jgi:hypothetical protein
MSIQIIKILRREANDACDVLAKLLEREGDEIWDEALHSKERPVSWGGSPEALHFWRKFTELYEAERKEWRKHRNAA